MASGGGGGGFGQPIDDLLEWFDSLDLPKRKANFLRNIPASVADAVLVAEIIHSVYPKLLQVRERERQREREREMDSSEGRKRKGVYFFQIILIFSVCSFIITVKRIVFKDVK